jgi:periplasmic protein CpxP/Spy
VPWRTATGVARRRTRLWPSRPIPPGVCGPGGRPLTILYVLFTSWFPQPCSNCVVAVAGAHDRYGNLSVAGCFTLLRSRPPRFTPVLLPADALCQELYPVLRVPICVQQIAAHEFQALETIMLRHRFHYMFLAILLAGYAYARPLQDQPQDQSSQSPAPSRQSQPGMGEHHGHGWGKRHDSQQQVQHLTKKLNLSSDQQAKIKSILDDQQSQAQTMRQDSSLSQQDRHSKMMQLRQTTHEQIRSALNPDQQQKFDAMVQKREQKMRNHREKGGNTEPAPTPQQ